MHVEHAALLWVTLIEGALTQGELQQSYEQLLEMRHECPSAWPALSRVFFTRMSASLLQSSSTTTNTTTAGVTAGVTAATAAGAAAAAGGGTDSNAVTTAGTDSNVQETSADATAAVDGTSSSDVALAADSASDFTAMDTDKNSTAVVQAQQQQQQQQQQLSSSSTSSDSSAAATAAPTVAFKAVVRVQRLTPAAFHLFVACMDTYNRLQGKIRAPVVPSDADAATASDTEAAAVAAAGGLQAMAKSYATAG
jgi:hypothetical protein